MEDDHKVIHVPTSQHIVFVFNTLILFIFIVIDNLRTDAEMI